MNVSVIIPTLNEANSLPRCLDALAVQTAPSDEIIVIDGGSEDGTPAIAADFGATVIEAETSIGEARQRGVTAATNPVIASTDADARPQPDWLDRIREHFADDPDLDLLWGTVTDTNGIPVRNLTGKFLTVIGGASGNNIAFRKRAVENMSGFPDLSFGEDIVFIERMARQGKVARDPDLAMRMAMDRRRYQSIPVAIMSVGSLAAGGAVGGQPGATLAGAGVGLGATELLYEATPTTRYHHDQVGFGLMLAGLFIDGWPGMASIGVGSGIVAHHLLTEGMSGLPSDLLHQTDCVCTIDGSGRVCVIPDHTSQLTRVLAGATAGGLAAFGISHLRAEI